MSDWTIVLSSDDAKQVVLYNAKEKQLAIKSDTDIMEQYADLSQRICSLCKRPFDTPYMYRNYFRVLAEAFEEQERSSKVESSSPKGRSIPRSMFNDGYYQQFFAELGRLGRGGGGSVFRCEHVLNSTVLGRYAVKKVPVGDNADWLHRLLHEVHMLEAMRHENVIEYKHAWLEEWQPSPFAPPVPHLFILMELAEEGSLEELFPDDESDNNRVDWINLFRQISLGLAHLHERGILHRDLKPSNILLKKSRNHSRHNSLIAVISDFGEAGSAVDTSRTRTGATGTIEYMAPELLRIDANGRLYSRHCTSSDIWSLGMVFYKCLFHRLPYTDIDDYELLHDEIASMIIVPIPNYPELSPPLRTLLRLMLSVDADARPSIKSVVDVLSALRPGDGIRQSRMLPPTFTPVSMDRSASSPSSATRKNSSSRKITCRFYVRWFALVHALPLILLAMECARCYPRAVRPWVVMVHLALALCSCYQQSVALTLLLGVAQGCIHWVCGGDTCAKV